MEILKKKGLSFDQQQQSQSFSPLSNSFKRRVLSGFGLGVLASLFLLFSLLLITFNSSATASPNSSPPFSWFSSPTTTGTSTTATSASSSSSLGHHDNKPSNNTSSSSSFFANSSDLGMTHLVNLTVDDDADISISAGDQVLDQETHAFDDGNNSSSSTAESPIFKNATVDLDNSISLVPQQPILEPTGQVKVEQVVDHINAPLDNGSKEDGMHRDFDEKRRRRRRRDNGWLHVDGGSNHDDEKNATSSESSSPTNGATRERLVINDKSCNIFNGGWVKDEREAFYPAGSCPYIDNDFNCHKNGRPDDEFLRWRWQPNGCNIPSLNATDFLARLRGKRLLFVGDSLNRNMWESLVCILRHSVKRKERVYEATGSHNFKTQGYYSFKFEDYNCSVDFVRSPFFVREIFFKNASGFDDERLRLDLLDETTSAYREADIIVFNTGHWWTHEKTSRGIDYYQEGDHVYPLLKVMEAYKKALTTWARWVDKNIDSSKTKVVFRGYSLTHFRGGQWNSGGQCSKETEPIFNETFLVKYPSKMRALEGVLEQMKTPVIYLNISRLTDYRKDGHPSIYRKMYKTVKEQIDAEKSQDCSHWCLPGIPDTWNELLYASLLIDGK